MHSVIEKLSTRSHIACVINLLNGMQIIPFELSSDFRFKSLYDGFHLSCYNPRKLHIQSEISLAFSTVSISQNTRIKGSVPEKRAIIHPPFSK